VLESRSRSAFRSFVHGCPMDHTAIAAVIRSLRAGASRRRLLAGPLGALASLAGLRLTHAKTCKKGKKKCGSTCCRKGRKCVSSWDGAAKQCCPETRVCLGSRTGCCSPGQLCQKTSALPDQPTHACVNP
jgi:hypothetical protein